MAGTWRSRCEIKMLANDFLAYRLQLRCRHVKCFFLLSNIYGSMGTAKMHLRVEGLEVDIATASNGRPSQYQSNEEYDEHTTTTLPALRVTRSIVIARTRHKSIGGNFYDGNMGARSCLL